MQQLAGRTVCEHGVEPQTRARRVAFRSVALPWATELLRFFPPPKGLPNNVVASIANLGEPEAEAADAMGSQPDGRHCGAQRSR